MSPKPALRVGWKLCVASTRSEPPALYRLDQLPRGVFEEKWEVTRVNGILRSSITVERGQQWIQKNAAPKPTRISI